MKATVLADNIADGELLGEWGLCIYIEYNGRKILLDTGASDRFVINAQTLHVDIEDVEYGILSHAHYDHADGMEYFFEKNKKACFFLRKGCGENCYKKRLLKTRYIGIKKGTLEAYKDRITYAEGKQEICPGVFLIPHSTEGLAGIGRKNHMYIKKRIWHADDFSHEQSLVFDTEKGLVIFNSCCHAGADTIIREAEEAFSGKRAYAVIGGFHLHERTEEEVRALAGRIRKTGVEKLYTGHCTGEKACHILEEELGGRVMQLYTGMEMEL
ncbi:MAG: MBL fold metallo-hydrolase [Lachnospiraceae bacterium]|nr:MBL fold metallo-hydrolase [Lachnospiraceae bacterium]MCI9344230.1 MBL fold metallo-hydrolase [Lachnospiraceae bacterium]